MSGYSNDFATALMLLKRGLPLSLDLIARLLAQGVDVSEMEKKYGC